jgi:hypothetical protein
VNNEDQERRDGESEKGGGIGTRNILAASNGQSIAAISSASSGASDSGG